MKLNLGCSTDLHGAPWINVDIVAPTLSTSGSPIASSAFQQADLSLPWPWEDSSVEEIYAADIFEHIGDCPHLESYHCSKCWPSDMRPGMKRRHWSGRIHVMNEAWRVLKPSGILRMECPDAAKGAGHFQDPTHVTPWTPNGLQYFADGSPAHKRFAAAYGISARFKVLGVAERMYEEWTGSNDRNRQAGHIRCEVWKFEAILEAVK